MKTSVQPLTTSHQKHIITIAGRPGSGKSTTAKLVAAQLGYKHFSSGDLFRTIAAEQGIDLMQANLSAEKNAKIDHLIDGRLQTIGESQDKLVIDTRMGWHWMPFSFKVFLDLDLTVAAQRILADMDEVRLTNEHVPQDPVKYARELQQRLDSETRRYKTLYQADPYNMTNYDLVVDTATNSINQVVDQVVDGFKKWLQD